MKLKDLKHNHSLTDLLKVLIFSILMLLPFIAVATRCLYVICNKNAYQSYSGNVTNKENIEINTDSLPLYDIYYNFTKDTTLPSSDGRLYFDNLEIIDSSLTQSQIDSLNNTNYFQIWFNETYNNTYITWNGLGTNLSYGTTIFYVKFDLVNVTNNMVGLSPIFKITDLNGLDNVFEYSVNKLENSDLFTWTQSTAIYTGVHAMTTGLDIQSTAIPMLITYWFLLTVIYIIIDIVIKVFTYLTHLIGNKSTE